jgi:TetR/AcrR family transcriptional regulator, transcriptional repressor for nem operon
MKVSKSTAAEHRAALLAAASRLFREKGFDKVGIAEIAAEVGLTHGAFYTHFPSKEALCVEAIATMTRGNPVGLKAAHDLDAFVAAYLSPQHVIARGDGCAFAALSGDTVRETEAIRSAFSQAIEHLIDGFAEALGDGRPANAARRARGIKTVASLIGGLLLARNVTSVGLRDEILSAMKASLR